MSNRYSAPAPDRDTLGDIVRDCRIKRGETIAEFAAAVGVSRTAVSRWERHSMAPSYERRLRIASLYPHMGDLDTHYERRAAYCAALHQAATAYSLTYKHRGTA